MPQEQLPNGSLELEPVVRKPSLTLAAPGPEMTQTISNRFKPTGLCRVLKARAAPLDKQFAECWVTQEPFKTFEALESLCPSDTSDPVFCFTGLESTRTLETKRCFLQETAACNSMKAIVPSTYI